MSCYKKNQETEPEVSPYREAHRTMLKTERELLREQLNLKDHRMRLEQELSMEENVEQRAILAKDLKDVEMKLERSLQRSKEVLSLKNKLEMAHSSARANGTLSGLMAAFVTANKGAEMTIEDIQAALIAFEQPPGDQSRKKPEVSTFWNLGSCIICRSNR